MAATLKLNTDGSPVSMIPLSTMSWKEAILQLVLDKVVVLEWHEEWIVRSVNWETRVPAVVILKEYEKRKATIRWSKQNVFLRDGFKCQYCGIDVSRKDATLDHVLPLSHGGKNTYENTVCACAKCNSTKGNDKHIRPKKAPIKPTYHQLVAEKRKLSIDDSRIYPAWIRYINP
jgi:5-methylcytosine-specific restriction endonuclease McrA